MTCAAPTTYTKCDTKRTVRNWPAVPGGICNGMYFRNGFSPNTTKIRPSKIRAINTAIFIFGSSPNQSMHEGAGTLHALAPHSMSNERLLWKSVLKPICPRTAFLMEDGMRRPVSRGMRYAPNVRRARGTMKRRPAMKEISTVRVNGNMIFKGHKLTIGVDLGDRWSCYCVLDEAGEILLEQKVATTPEAMKQIFEKIPRGLIAMETGTHSPWVSRLLKELGHAVLVAHAQKVQLITKSNRKDDRHDARTLARLARIDPELLGPVRHRSAKAQIHLTVIRARAELVSARTGLVNAARGLVKSYGQRLPKCGTQQVSRELAAELSAELREGLEPPLKEIESLNERIQEYDVRMEKIAKESYPQG